MSQPACLVVNPIMFDNIPALLNYTPVHRASDSIMVRPKAIRFCWLGPELYRLLLGRSDRVVTDDLLLLQISSGVIWHSRDLQMSRCDC